MFYKSNDNNYRTPIDGVRMKTLVHGDKTHMVEFRLKPGAIVPEHSHPHEQTGYLVSGKIRFTSNAKVTECGAGDSWCIPGDQKHGAEALEESVLIEVFSPVREDYL